jgi:hypothetical protein
MFNFQFLTVFLTVFAIVLKMFEIEFTRTLTSLKLIVQDSNKWGHFSYVNFLAWTQFLWFMLGFRTKSCGDIEIRRINLSPNLGTV